MKKYKVYYTVPNEFGTAMTTIKARSKSDAQNIFKKEHPFDYIVEILEA